MRSSQVYVRYRALLRAGEGIFSGSDLKKIRFAADLLTRYCDSGKTAGGVPLVNHALNVARIVVGEMGLGASAATAALICNVWEHVRNQRSNLEKNLGKSTVIILEGISKINQIHPGSTAYQSERFCKLLLSLADDIRVILIKLSERLDLMRNLDNADDKEKLALSSETYFLYAPLAHRLGMYNIKSELEDLSVKHLDPENYEFIYRKLKNTASSRNRLIREFSVPVKEQLIKYDFKFTIKSRTKSIHSILSKIKKQGVGFEEIYDIFAVRIILDSKPEREKSDCWQVYSLITDLYQPNPNRLRDWISLPKSNGYESLHTTVAGPRGKWVEVQIRTKRMDEIAEKGLAAHYKYKGARGESGLDKWLAGMREVLESSEKDDSSIDQMKSGLFSDEVFVFTPKGDLRQLPAGSTVLDFAFDIHSEIGCKCVGAKVNGKNVTIRQVLQNGDQVSIITSRNQKPNRDWLSFTVTTKAKSKIRQTINEEKALAAAKGKEMLTRRLRNWKIPFSDSVIITLQSHYNHKTAQDLYFSIAEGKTDLLKLKDILTGTRNAEEEAEAAAMPQYKARYYEPEYTDYLVIDEKVEGLDYRLAKCCNPVFGDRIFGFVTISDGIKIHRTLCPNAKFLTARYPYRMVAARWTHAKNAPAFRVSIKVTGIAGAGIVNKIADILSELRVTLRSFNYNMEDDKFEGVLQIMTSNNDVLQVIINKINAIKGVLRAVRQDSDKAG